MTQQTVSTWETITPGTIVRVVNHAPKPFFFLVMGVDPTYAFSPVAWLRGLKVTAAGKPVPQIDQLHMPEHMREELANIVDCKVVGRLELSPKNGRARKARGSAK